MGLMQIMPVAYQDYCTATGEQYNESKLYDPRTNIRVGTYWLARWYDYYGNWDTALAAYNAGPGNVNSWLEDARYSDGDGILFDMPFEQTEKYVQKVNRYKTIYDRLYT
jgi:soluble lytic murein transglycosylase